MLEPILQRYEDFLATLDLQAPQMPFVSNRSGQMITAEEATSPAYWVGQLRNTVNFADCITTLSAPRKRVFLEVGPGKALSALAQMGDDVAPAQVLSSLRHPEQDMADDAYFLGVIGRLWACGVEADWSQIWGEARRNRVVLPTYQFQRAKYFIEPGKAVAAEAAPALTRSDDIADWGAVPAWRPRFADVDMDVTADLGDVPLNWLIFGDEAGRAGPVIRRLREAGHTVIAARAGDSFAALDDHSYSLAAEQGRLGYDQLIAALKERDLMPDRIGHFWLTDDNIAPRPGSSVFDRNLEQGFWSLTWLAQALSEAELEGDLHLTVFTAGSTQVRNEAVPHPEEALISGPVGVFARELPGVTCAQVDLEVTAAAEPAKRGWFAKAAPEAAAETDLTDRLLEDLLAAPANTIAAHRGDKRYEMSFKDIPLKETDAPTFRDGGTYLITGGFGGIGQTLAADVLRSHKANVILLSRDAMPDRSEWDSYLAHTGTTDRTARRLHAVKRLEDIASATGGTVEVAHADVTNIAQMRRVIDDLTQRHGGLTGVIHAAGHLDDAPLLAKTDAQMEAVLAPKVQGLRVLDQLLPDGALELMVLFSSTSTATRAAGQVDYVAANAWLNAFAASRKGAKTKVVAVNWGVWADVGMAANAISGGASDVLPPRKLQAALLDTAGADASGHSVFTAPLKSSQWLLDQHRTKNGQAILPGTGYLELLAEAAQAQGLKQFEIHDLYFLRAMSVEEHAQREMQITLHPSADGFAAEMRSDCVLQGKPGWQLHAQASLSAVQTPAPSALTLSEIEARCGTVNEATVTDRIRSPQEAHLDFGPRWHVLRSTAFGSKEGIARLSLPEEVRADLDDGHILHPGLMDLATGWAISLVPGYENSHLWVPVSYGAIRVHAPLPAEIRSWVRLSNSTQGDGFANFDVTLTDAAGNVLVEVSNFAMKRLEGGFDAAPLTQAEVRFDNAEENETPLSAAEERLAYLVSQGIRAHEGPDALRRALNLGKPQVMVSSLPLSGLIAQADQPAQEAASTGQSFERPDLDGTYVAPRNSIEERLADIWQNLLGVSPVGVEDSFFDLGGHSLIAVRLFASVKREFKVEFPISVLFEAPTIAKCAALIAAETGETGEGDAPAEAAPVEKFEFLVPLNQSAEKDATPLFIVAGMFGNVLNMRHIAMPFATERKVYGVQARGLIGDTPPHNDIIEAARDYLAEIRRVQPHGPYLISGYSGGGVTAYEMAQQLRAMGEEVAVLAMLDTPLPVRPSLTRPDKALIKISEIRSKGPRYLVDWARARWAWEKQKRSGAEVPQESNGSEYNDLKVQAGFLEGVGKYDTPQWDGPLTLFRPPLDLHWKVSGDNWVSAEREYVYEDNQWRQYAPALEVIEVPGDHVSMVLAPNVTTLAAELREVIDRALDGGHDPWAQATAAE